MVACMELSVKLVQIICIAEDENTTFTIERAGTKCSSYQKWSVTWIAFQSVIFCYLHEQYS